jgi:4-amino-4-deoxy-L-arabinose transferase-like glycosyltransferase
MIRRFWFPGALIIASLSIRILTLSVLGVGAIENEGAEYARLAENLRHGVGYVGIAVSGPQLLFNPGYPVLIAATSYIVPNFAWAARIVSLVFGSVFPLVLFAIAEKLFDRRVGIVAGVLAAASPLLVNLSFTTYSEGPYYTAMFASVYATLLALRTCSWKAWALTGAVFAAAFLIRAEVAGILAIALLFGLLIQRSKRVLAAMVVFLILVAPNAAYLYQKTSRIVLEGKSTLFYAFSKRILDIDKHQVISAVDGEPSPAPNVDSYMAWTEKWMYYAVDKQGRPIGTTVTEYPELFRATHITLVGLVRLVVTGLRMNAPSIFSTLNEGWIGAPVLPALALLGIVWLPWRTQVRERLFYLCVCAAHVLTMFTYLWVDQRHCMIFTPLLLVWAAAGLVAVASWARESIRLRWMEYAVPVSIALVMITAQSVAIRKLWVFADGAKATAPEVAVGSWLGRQHGGPLRIMDQPLALAYHAGAEFTYAPYCSEAAAIRYLDLKRVDYVVLRRNLRYTHYYADWIERGIPDPRAERIDTSFISGGDKYVIYRWHPSGASVAKQ